MANVTKREQTREVLLMTCQSCKKIHRNGRWITLSEREKEELKDRIVHEMTTLCDRCQGR